MQLIRKIRTSVSPCFYTDQNSFPTVASDVDLGNYSRKYTKERRLIFKFLHVVALNKQSTHKEKTTTFYK